MTEYKNDWDAETGSSLCLISSGNHIGYGSAICHEEDKDFASERTGAIIAEYRAEINLLQDIKNNEVIPAINALRHLQGTMTHSKRYNPKSYEANRLRREIENYEMYLASIKSEIKEIRKEVKRYIDEKDNFYKKVREAKNN